MIVLLAVLLLHTPSGSSLTSHVADQDADAASECCSAHVRPPCHSQCHSALTSSPQSLHILSTDCFSSIYDRENVLSCYVSTRRDATPSFSGLDVNSVLQEEVLSRRRRKLPDTNVDEAFEMRANYKTCCRSNVGGRSSNNMCSDLDSCHQQMDFGFQKSNCKSQEGIYACLETFQDAYKSCTKNRYPSDDRCQRLCQKFLDGMAVEPVAVLNQTVQQISKCDDVVAGDLSTMVDYLKYYKGTQYESCCDEIESRGYKSWSCAAAQCKQMLQTFDVRLSHPNLVSTCVSSDSRFNDSQYALLHLHACLKIDELNASPRLNEVPEDPRFDLILTLPSSNGFGHYCCQFVPRNDFTCRKFCDDMFVTNQNVAGAEEKFEMYCSYKSGMQQATSCIMNLVAGQCRPGCSRMNFCNAFNNKLDTTFRRCTDTADAAASSLYETWSRSNRLSFQHLGSDDSEDAGGGVTDQLTGVGISLKDISNCEPLVFKAVACSLTIKPCSYGHSSRICVKDCVRLFTNCGNFSSGNQALEAQKTCSRLLGKSEEDEDDDCVSFYDLSGGAEDYELAKEDVTYPCSSSNLCRDSKKEMCLINRQEVLTVPAVYQPPPTIPNTCVRGCSMQEWSTMHHLSVPGDIVITSWNDEPNKCAVCKCVGNIDTHRTGFYCDPDNANLQSCNFFMEKRCAKKPPSSNVPMASRLVSEGSNTEDMTDFQFQCNFCSCLNSTQYCTKRLCVTDYKLDKVKKQYGIEFTGMPQNADDEFLVTCASNGRTYPNDQVAKALGFREDSQFQLGACEERRRCYNSLCGPNHRCVTQRQVCISKSRECKQYICVPEDKCLRYVCDEYGITQPNMCDMNLPIVASRGFAREIAYDGRCQQKCRREQVCGTNGHTYSSACAAFNDRVLVDYPGRCRDFAVQIDDTTPRKCYKIGGCKPLPAHCKPVHAFGTCCPICGAVARLVYVPQLVDMVHDTLAGDQTHPPDQYTVKDVVLAVRQHITLSQCDVFGHLSLDDSVTLMFTVPYENPTPRQVDACNGEAKRIVSLLVERDITLISNIHLFPIAGADVQTSFVKMGTSALHPSLQSLSLFLILYILR